MGEITDMFLDGTLCEECGALIEDMTEGAIELPNGKWKMVKKPPGYPRKCKDCEEGI